MVGMFWNKKPQVEPWPEDQPIPLNHSLVPDEIRNAVLELLSEGDELHRVPTDDRIEWWLLDDEGELTEAFWL